MTAKRTTILDSSLLKRLTGMPYEDYDEGRCRIFQLGKHEWMGLRVESQEIIKARDPSSIKVRHDCQEMSERKVRAGLDDYKWGTVNSHREDKVLKAEQELQRQWMMKLWVPELS